MQYIIVRTNIEKSQAVQVPARAKCAVVLYVVDVTLAVIEVPDDWSDVADE
jgi:hypothetical protein